MSNKFGLSFMVFSLMGFVSASQAQNLDVSPSLGINQPIKTIDSNNLVVQNNSNSSVSEPSLQYATEGENVTLIQGIDFESTDKEGTEIIIDVKNSNGKINIKKYKEQTIIRFLDAQIDPRLVKTFNVADTSRFVKTVDVFVENQNIEIIITPIEGRRFSQLSYQSNDKFYVEMLPLSSSGNDTVVANQYNDRTIPNKDKRVSLSFQNIDIRQLLQIIANVASINIVVSDSVTGNMALELRNVVWSQALDIILNAKGLGMTRQNNVITVAPLAEIALRKREELAAQEATKILEPLTSEIIQINYAQASDLAALLRSNETSFLTERGKVAVDNRTNSLLISETRSKISEIKQLINRLDIPVKQVLIKSRIVVANESFSEDLGVRFGGSDQGTLGNKSTSSGFNVDLPVSSPAGQFSASILGDSFNLDLALSVLQAENQGEVISQPRIITSNGKEGSISQGVEIPYLEAASSGAATVSFKEAILELNVKPQITPDDNILMDLAIRQDSQGDSVNVQGGGQVPSINTRTLNTQVLIKDGDTVVLGGIFTSETQNVKNKIPVLGDIPVIGALFRNSSSSNNKRELLIFISPSVVDKEKLKNIE